MSTPILIHMLVTVGMIAATWGLYVWYSSGGRRGDERSGSDFSPVALMRFLIVPVVLSLVLFFLPLALMDVGHNDLPLTALFDSLIRASQIFSLDMSIRDVWETTDALHLTFTAADRVWLSFILMVAPLLTLGVAVSLFQLPKFWVTLLLTRRDIYIFSDLNDRAKMYAKALTHADTCRGASDRPYIVFCSDGHADTVDESNILGGSIVLKRSIVDLHLPASALRRVYFYLMTDDENIIIEQASRLQEKYMKRGCHIYCVSAGELNEDAVDQMNAEANPDDDGSGAGGAEMIHFDAAGRIAAKSLTHAHDVQTSFVEIIDETARVVYQSLYEKPLISPEFLNKVSLDDDKGGKTLRVLVLGAGTVGAAFVRTLMWYCQMPGIGVEVTVADKEDEKTIRGRVFKRNEQFEQMLASIGYADRARLVVKETKDFLTSDLEELLAEAAYHKIIITTGDDGRDYQLALRARRYFLRHPRAWGCPDIRVVIWDDNMTRLIGGERFVTVRGVSIPKGEKLYMDYGILAPQGAEPLYNEKCRVELMGSMSSILNTNVALRYDALRYHAFYSGDGASDSELCAASNGGIGISKACYYSFYKSRESEQRSNWAIVIHGKIKHIWQKSSLASGNAEEDSRALAENEHIRWCIFKLLEGDCPVPDEILERYYSENPKGRDGDPIRGYHVILRSWSSLQELADREPDKWKQAYENNMSLVRFALALEAGRERNAAGA